MAAHQAPPSLGFSRQEHWSGLPFPSPMRESEKCKWSRSVMSDSSWPHGPQPTRLLRPWDFPGKSTGMGCHCLLCWAYYGRKTVRGFFFSVEILSMVTQLRLTSKLKLVPPALPMDAWGLAFGAPESCSWDDSAVPASAAAAPITLV